MDDARTERILAALRSGVAPATGCTEPISLAYAAARAAAELGEPVERIRASVSPNVMKNAMAVMVPGTGMPGLEIAAAVGALDGDPTAGLAVLGSLTPGGVSAARRMVDEGRVAVEVADVTDDLFAQATVLGAGHAVTVSIAGSHTNVYRVERDGRPVLDLPRPEPTQATPTTEFLRTLTLRDCYDVATTVPVERIEFILEAEQLNRELSEAGQGGNYGLGVGRAMLRAIDAGLSSGDLSSRMVALTSAASDARMGGAPLPAMTNAGSGNQGITATLPVSIAADDRGATREERIRALTLSHLTALYIHASLPVLSAFCAAVTAGMGAAAGLGLLLDGRYQTVERAVSTMAGDTIGMVCDGAGASCAMKVASSVGSATRAVLLALNDARVPGNNGMVFDDVDETIRGIGRLATRGMAGTDPEILQIMLSKSQASGRHATGPAAGA
ncbi:MULTISPECIES: L-cysteine desulfidase family protein [unclassified Luteococcus]|uniref:L-cysteine desulfidase family protein n=1 Tax=unclassified Luteococcus TaxID=2639923 RepID=UPI00313B8BBA